jgi:hypothetical protein
MCGDKPRPYLRSAFTWRLSRGRLPSGTVLCDALFMCVGSITIDSLSSGRVPVSSTELRVGCTLCASLVCEVCVEINNPHHTSGRPLLDGWAAAHCLRTRPYAAPFYVCGLDYDRLSEFRASSSLAHGAPSRLHSVCQSCVWRLLVDDCWGPSGSQRLMEGMTEVFPNGLGAGPGEGTRTCVSLEDPPSSHMLVSVQAILRCFGLHWSGSENGKLGSSCDCR